MPERALRALTGSAELKVLSAELGRLYSALSTQHYITFSIVIGRSLTRFPVA